MVKPEPDHEIVNRLVEIADVGLAQSVRILKKMIEGDKENWRVYHGKKESKAILHKAMAGSTAIALPEPIVQHVRGLGFRQCILDGESVGDVYHAFDVLELDESDLRLRPYSDRLKALARLTTPGRGEAAKAGVIHFAETAGQTSAKRAMVQALRTGNREGVVFKRHDAHYAPGRPASGGSQVKLKFTASASCIVAKVNGSKRSVALTLIDGKSRPRKVGVGNVTIPSSHAIPGAGDIVEVRYLYAFAGEGGSLYQPVYLGKRDDIEEEACSVGQLKYKADSGGEEDES